jgi:putative tricarboxylic transport membrane protein
MRLLSLRQDLVGGLVLIGVGAFAFWQSGNLAVGTLGGMGPGMMPKSLAILLGALGAMLAVQSIRARGDVIERWTLRGPLFVLGAVIAFGSAIRPAGLLVAAPLAIFIGALASKEVRWSETFVFGAIVTAFCIVLFKFALGLPIPLAPWLIGY